jgi:pyruvate formate lyase activating enzyme
LNYNLRPDILAIPCEQYFFNNKLTMATGEIFDIKKYAIHDGPGIRTTVFFKGCPLTCWWCHNPESISPVSQRLYRKERCIGCRECVDACTENCIEVASNGLNWNQTECLSCGVCATRCPAEAIEFIGKKMTVDEVLAEISKDTVFYDESFGGITISGGEPLMQPSFLIELLDACKKMEFHRTVDTSGYAETRTLLETATRTDLFLYDLKHMDSEKHARFTGVHNEIILSNLKMLSQQDAEVVVRFPVVPGFNSDPENIENTGDFISSLPGIRRVDILPYHCTAAAKYKKLGLKFNTSEVSNPTREILVSIAEKLEKFGLEIKIGGCISDTESS